MPTYAYACPVHGEFTLVETMQETRRLAPCPVGDPRCGRGSPKVLANVNMQFTQGRAAFHDGVEGTGETNRETTDRWLKEFKDDTGREAIPAPSGCWT